MWYTSHFDRINKIWLNLKIYFVNHEITLYINFVASMFTNACVNNVKHYEKVKTHSDIENTETKKVWKTGYSQIFDFDDRYIFSTCALL